MVRPQSAEAVLRQAGCRYEPITFPLPTGIPDEIGLWPQNSQRTACENKADIDSSTDTGTDRVLSAK